MTTTQPAALPEHELLSIYRRHELATTDLVLSDFKRIVSDALAALAALQSQPAAAGVPDEAILRAAQLHMGVDAVAEVGTPSIIATVRAILALRPQAVPIGRDDLKMLMSAAGYVHATAQEKADFINGFRNAEVHHGITQRADGGEKQA